MSKSFGFKKCKMCQQTKHSENNCWSRLEFMVEGEFYCLSCLEKKGTNCRWCHKSINLLRDCAQCVYDGSGLFGGEVDTSTVCCLDCLRKFEYEEDEWGHEKRIESDQWKKCQIPGCEYIISRHEEAIGYDKWCRSCTQNKREQERREKSKEGEQTFGNYKRFQQKAQNWWISLSSQEREKECERLVKSMKQGKYWANNVDEGEGSGWAHDGSYWTIENGKFTSSSPHLVPIQIVEEFMQKELGTCDVLTIEYGLIKSKRVKDDLPLEIEEGERNSEKQKKIEIVNNNKSNNEVLFIDLKKIKKITLRGNNKLEIEFNSVQKDQNVNCCYLVNQIITNEQVDSNQDLKAVRDYLQKTGKDDLNHQELAEFFSSDSVPAETLKDTNKFLWIGGVGLVSGLLVCLLFLSRRLNWKKR